MSSNTGERRRRGAKPSSNSVTGDLVIQNKNISELKPAKYNPRKDLTSDDPEYQKIKKSILAFNYVDPVIWNKQTGNVISGHQRLKIMKELGHKQIDVSVVDVDKVKEKALNIAMNKISGEWDFPKLKELLDDLEEDDFDLDLTGFDLDERDSLFDDKELFDGGLGGGGSDGAMTVKLAIPKEVWFDSQSSIKEKVESVCSQYGIVPEWPE